MGYCTKYRDFLFIEGCEKFEKNLGVVECSLDYAFGAHLKTLDDVKDELIFQAKRKGANAIIQFVYGQKTKWFAIDNVYFWGKGVAVVINEDHLKEKEH